MSDGETETPQHPLGTRRPWPDTGDRRVPHVSSWDDVDMHVSLELTDLLVAKCCSSNQQRFIDVISRSLVAIKTCDSTDLIHIMFQWAILHRQSLFCTIANWQSVDYMECDPWHFIYIYVK